MTEKKLNIAVVGDAITDFTAGSFLSALRFSERLKQRGHKIVFLAARSPKNPENSIFRGIKVYRFQSMPLPKTKRQLYLALPGISKIKKIFEHEKIDIAYLIIPTPLAIAAVKAAKELGIKVAAHSHTQPENILIHVPEILGSNLLIKPFYKYIYWIYDRADAVIFPTKLAQSYFLKLKKTIKQAVISNGVDTKEFRKMDPGPFFRKFGLSHQNKNILYVGRLQLEKHLETLISALPAVSRHIPNTHIYIVGEGDQKGSLEHLARKLGFEEQVHFLGRLAEGELAMAYSACDVFVLPSVAELESMVVLEAMSCAMPVLIANAKDSAATQFVEKNGYLFEPENAGDLAEKIAAVLGNDPLRQKMSKASLAKSRDYDINQSVSKLETLFLSLLDAQ